MKIIKSIIAILAISGCAQFHKVNHTQVMEYNQAVGDKLVAHKYGDIYFSGQPSNQDVEKLKQQGFVHIINLRNSQEENYKELSEAQIVKTNQIYYSHIPMDLNQPLSDQYIKKVVAGVMTHRKEGKTLIHCSSGQRAALWAGAHFFKDHKYSEAKVENMTEKMGLENTSLKEKLNEYLSK